MPRMCRTHRFHTFVLTFEKIEARYTKLHFRGHTELVRASPKYSAPQQFRPDGRNHLIRATSQRSPRPLTPRTRLREQPENGSEDGFVRILARTSGSSSDSVDGNQNVRWRGEKRVRVSEIKFEGKARGCARFGGILGACVLNQALFNIVFNG